MNGTVRGCLALALVALTAMSVWPVDQALGPKDGTDLAPTDLERITPGVPAPDFTLEDQNGRPITLSAYRQQHPVVLVFYRGHW